MKNIQHFALRIVLTFVLFCLFVQLFFLTLDLFADDATVTKISSKVYHFINQ